MILAVKIEYVLILALATLVFIVLSAILAFLLWRKKKTASENFGKSLKSKASIWAELI